MAATQSPEFKKAAEESRQLKTKPTDTELLDLYAHFKQGSQDPSFENASKPGTLDFTGKAKYNAWKKVAEAGMSPEEAQKKYIEIVEKLKEKYGFDG